MKAEVATAKAAAKPAIKPAEVQCVDAETAADAVRQCQIEVLGHAVTPDTRVGDVLQTGDSLDKFRSCVARRAGLSNVGCAASTTFRQVASSITCP
jgi:hypothetical protein